MRKRNLISPITKGEVYFKAVGNGMNDGTERSILDGDILTGESIEVSQLTSKLKQNKHNLFFIESTNTHFIADVVSHNESSGEALTRSFNLDKETYPDRVIKIADVQRLYVITKRQRCIAH